MSLQVKIPLVVILALLLTMSASAESIRIGGLDGLDPAATERPIPILVALSGGGARGLASIGVLKALEENGFAVAGITGTSTGGIVGGLYACGYNAAQIHQIVRKIDYSTLFSNEPSRLSMLLTRRYDRERHLISVRFDGLRPQIPHGLTSGQELASLLTALTNKAIYKAGGDFLKLKVPFKTVCTDIISGEQIVISQGSLADALQGTTAFPLAFTGVDREDRWLMDGGMLVPVPVDIARTLSDSVGFVLAVNCASTLRSRKDIVTPVDIADQVTSIMTVDKLITQLSHANFVIQPPLGSITSTDFARRDSIIDLGYHATLAVMDSLKTLARARLDTTQLIIQRVQVIGGDTSFAQQAQELLVGHHFGQIALTQTLQQLCSQTRLFQLDAEITPDSILPASATSPARVVAITLTPHACLDDRRLRWNITGSTVFVDSAIQRCVRGNDSIVRPAMVQARLERVINLYRAEQYDLADFRSVTVDFATQTISGAIDEALVKGIDVSNNDRSRDWLVRSYFPLQRQRPYSSVRAAAGLKDIYGTDLFDRVTLNLLPRDSQAIVDIDVRERKHTQARLGWHWDDTYQSEEFLEILDDDVAGIGMECLFHARYSDDRQSFYGETRVDRIFNTYLTAQMRVYRTTLDRTTFTSQGEPDGVRSEATNGAYLRLGQQIHRLGTVTAGVQFDQIDLDGDHVGNFESFSLRRVEFESLVENYDRLPFPETGKRHLAELSFAGKYLGGDAEYTRFFSSLEGYFPLTRRINYHPKVSLGLSRHGLPPSERFYIGGQDSFSGYRTDEWVGDKMAVLNQEVRFRLLGWVYLLGKYDVGNVWETSDQIRLKDIRHGWGGALACRTPIGPMQVGYGVTGDNSERWYFSLGYTF